MAADNGNSNTYEEARKLRLEENKKRFEDLGISNISKSLSNLTTPEKKKTKQGLPKPKSANTQVVEPRRSSRTRNAVVTYADEMDIELPTPRKRFKSSSSSWTGYVARPLDEVKLASYEDRIGALRVAEEFQSSLQSGYPSFVKSMVRSHVYSCFWLGLPSQFCKNHLPKKDLDMILEDENGSAYDAKYLGGRTGLSGGWRAFALEHKLDDGDAVVFELVEEEKFKVYTFRISSLSSAQTQTVDKEGPTAKKASKEQKKNVRDSSNTQKSKKGKSSEIEVSDAQEPQPQKGISEEEMSEDIKSIEKNGFVPEEEVKKRKWRRKMDVISVDKEEDKQGESDRNKEEISVDKEEDEKGESGGKKETVSVGKKGNEEVTSLDKTNQGKRALQPRKKPAPRLFRKK